MNLLLADLAGGVLAAAAPAHADVAMDAERLSALHSERLGTRSLGILHVATAIVLGAADFLTFNRRQMRLAKAAGLRAPAL